MIRDRATQFTRTFDNVFTANGADAIPTPPGAPNANAFAERWVRTVRHELSDRTLIWNQRQLRRLLDEYLEHYNTHRWS
ncbi:MAG: transposase [Actinomycetia bacterium]|nr:transposase [Actinomycetes bacterium]